MKKLILILALMFCLIFSGTALGFEKVDVSGVNFSSTTVFVAKIQTFLGHGLGTSSTAVALVDDEPAFTIYATSDQTSGVVQSAVISLVVGGAGTIVEGLHVVVSTEYMSGSWINAIVGKLDFGTTGSAGGGMAASIVAELNMSAQASPGGSYYNVHSYFSVPDDAELIDSTSFNYAFEKYESADNATNDFDLYGLLWHIVGLDDNSGKVFYGNTLKIQIDTTKWYIPLSTTEATYTATYPIRINTSTTAPEVAADGSDLGLAGYFQADITGVIPDSNTYGFGAWVNLDVGTTLNATAKYLAAQDNGIYDPGATVTDARIVFGMRAEAIMDGTGYEFLVPFSLNSNQVITAIFAIDNIESIGFIEATTETADPVGYVPFFYPVDGSIRYIRLYNDTS